MRPAFSTVTHIVFVISVVEILTFTSVSRAESPTLEEIFYITDPVDPGDDSDEFAAGLLPLGVAEGFWVAWTHKIKTENSTDAYARIFELDGSATDDPFLVNEQTEWGQSSDSLDFCGDSLFIGFGAFSEIDSSEIRGRIFAQDGVPESGELTLAQYVAGNQGGVSLVCGTDNSTVVGVWSTDAWPGDEDGGLSVRAFNVDGIPAGDELQVNTYFDGYDWDPSLAALDDGRYVVGWYHTKPPYFEDLNAMPARYLDANGVPQGDAFDLLDGAEGFDNGVPRLAPLPGARFAATWEDWQYDPDVHLCMLRFFDAQGLPEGDPFPVMADSEFGCYGPVAMSNDDGVLMVTWFGYAKAEDVLDDPEGRTEYVRVLYGRQYEADGGLMSDPFPIVVWNDMTIPWEQNAASLTDGRFVVVWRTQRGENEPYDLMGRIVGIATPPYPDDDTDDDIDDDISDDDLEDDDADDDSADAENADDDDDGGCGC